MSEIPWDLWNDSGGITGRGVLRCTFHFYRNIFSVTLWNKIEMATMMLRSIRAQENKDIKERTREMG